MLFSQTSTSVINLMLVLLLGLTASLAAVVLAVKPTRPPVTPGSGNLFGYLRTSTDRQALSPDVQRQTVEAAAQRLLGRGIDVWFQDAPTQNPDGSWNDAQSGKVPIAERNAGRRMCARLNPGDVVIVAKVDRAFRRLSDCVAMLDRWERIGVGLLLCDFPMLSDLSSPFGKAMIQLIAIFAEVERKLISQRTKEALALRKRRKQAHARFPGYGFRWERRWDKDQSKHVKMKVADPEERTIMGQIVGWKEADLGWDAITLRLARDGIKTKDGTPWSRSRVIRAFRAELALRAREDGDADR
jgi:DNA invertase Pin-like site-specific DNA recombinase